MTPYYNRLSENTIHPTAVKNNYIGPYCVLQGNTVIGDNNRFESHCSIGSPAEHRDYFTQAGELTIGDNNTFREFVTVNAGSHSTTVVRNNVVMLRNSHVGHDSFIDNKVNLSCNVLIGGHSHIMEGANFGLGSICHQFSKIGAYAMVGMGCIIPKGRRIEPAHVVVGNPSRFIKLNEVGLTRNNISPSQLDNFRKQYEELYENN
jgi:UDP-N-acetylglucosamine acyltransferase